MRRLFQSKSLVVATMLLTGILAGCKKSEYTRLVERELSRNVRYDSLFLGIHFGMSKKEFFEKCWALNRQHLVTMGSRGSNVLYKFTDSVGTIDMHFYPNFDDDKAYEMPVNFNYENWAPWNRQCQPDSLEQRLKRMFETWYGPGFIKVDRGPNDHGYVKMDGNRRILIYRSGEQDVKVLFTDMAVAKEIDKAQ